MVNTDWYVTMVSVMNMECAKYNRDNYINTKNKVLNIGNLIINIIKLNNKTSLKILFVL